MRPFASDLHVGGSCARECPFARLGKLPAFDLALEAPEDLDGNASLASLSASANADSEVCPADRPVRGRTGARLAWRVELERHELSILLIRRATIASSNSGVRPILKQQSSCRRKNSRNQRGDL